MLPVPLPPRRGTSSPCGKVTRRFSFTESTLPRRSGIPHAATLRGHAVRSPRFPTTIALPWVGEQEITTIAQAGLGLGVVGFVFGFIALIVAIGACMTKTQKPRSQEIPVRNLDVPKSAV